MPRLVSERVSLRISPGTPRDPLNDIVESASTILYSELVQQLARLGLAYLHLVEKSDHGLNASIRSAWPVGLIVNPRGLEGTRAGKADAERALTDGADATSFGRAFLANPDLPRRLDLGADLTVAEREWFYGGDHRGYLDWPTLDDIVGAPGAPT